MALEESLTRIKEFLLDRYEDNLAGILLFGSANTGEFRQGESDVDTMIFLKEQRELDTGEEIRFLIKSLKSERFATQYFHTLEGIVQHIKERKSFSVYITMVGQGGSKTLYSTPEFEETREQLRKNPPSKKEIKKFIKEKDDFELDGYFRDIKNFELTKALFAHLRKKLQVRNYFKTREFIFDYNRCMNNLDLSENEKRELHFLYDVYSKRKSLTETEVDKYCRLAKEFTDRIIEA